MVYDRTEEKPALERQAQGLSRIDGVAHVMTMNVVILVGVVLVGMTPSTEKMLWTPSTNAAFLFWQVLFEVFSAGEKTVLGLSG